MKKKTIKKAGAAVLTMAMLLSMGAMTLPVYAATTAITSTISLKGAPGKYNIYQVASAEVDNNTGAVTYKINDPFTGVLGIKDLDIVSKVADADVPVAVDDKLNTMSDYGSKAEFIANKLAKVVKSSTTAQTSITLNNDTTAGTASITKAGYYLILGVVNGYTQPVLVYLVPDSTNTALGTKDITVKNSEIDFTKTIAEILAPNSKNNVISEDKSTGIVEKNAVVTYNLDTTFPSYDTDVTALNDHFTITDIPEDSLAIKYDTIKVYINGSTDALEPGTTTFTLTTENIDNAQIGADYKQERTGAFVKNIKTTGSGFQIVFADSYVLNHKTESVKVEFDATVSDNDDILDINLDSNDNGATLSYSNNYFTGKGKVEYKKDKNPDDPTNPGPDEDNGPDEKKPLKPDETPDEPKVIPGSAKVYCTTLEVDKVKKDSNNEALAGASFALYKGAKAEVIENGQPKAGSKVVLTIEKDDATKATGSEVKNIFTFNGLGEGTYTLVETPPEGYIGSDPIEITITAGKVSENYNGSFTFTRDKDSASAKMYVENTPKKALPATGGIGSIIFTVTGAAIIVLACVLFVIYMKKRKTWEE